MRRADRDREKLWEYNTKQNDRMQRLETEIAVIKNQLGTEKKINSTWIGAIFAALTALGGLLGFVLSRLFPAGKIAP